MHDQSGRDLVLGQNEFAYVRDDTKGRVSVIVGPNKMSLAATDKPVKFDPETSRFVEATSIRDAISTFVKAPTGHYVVLDNPREDYPPIGTMTDFKDLKNGEKVNIPGPFFAALWPGQNAEVLQGHNLRSNQYLICRVYDASLAEENWDKGIVKEIVIEEVETEVAETQEGEATTEAIVADGGTETAVTSSWPGYATGELFIIKGTEAKFYIPPSGVEVLPDDNGNYLRKAATLEQLDYTILLDENGSKRFVRGPAVVFPKTTEKFKTHQVNGQITRKFKAIELNEISGIYVKVIAPYEENDKQYNEGEELFITGKDQMIYFPRPEHSIIKYEGNAIHYATAIPEGEARYFLDRINGKINTVKGPKMFLADPRKEVMVKRVLSEDQVRLWFPGNNDAIDYNRNLENSFPASANNSERKTRSLDRQFAARYSASDAVYDTNDIDWEESKVNLDSGDSFNRRSTYTKPRTVTIDSKFDGAVKIQPWTGYAVQVVTGKGERKVIPGPAVHHLGYDETLEKIQLSTGKPKNTDQLREDVYLRVKNNKISDIITAETADMVSVQIKVSYRVDFVGDENKWFEVENYVKYLCDHCRSIVRNKVKKLSIQDFHKDYIDITRDTILGNVSEKDEMPIAGYNRGRLFDENGMFIKDVELLDMKIMDRSMSELLDNAQREVATNAIEFTIKSQELDIFTQLEELKRKKAELELETIKQQEQIAIDKLAAKETTKVKQHELELEQIDREHEVTMTSIENTHNEAQDRNKKSQEREMNQLNAENAQGMAQLEAEKAEDAIRNELSESLLKRDKEARDLEEVYRQAEVKRFIEKLEAEAKADKERMAAIEPGLIEALQSVAQTGMLETLSGELAPLSIVKGQSLGSTIQEFFKDTKFEGSIANLISKVENRD